MTFKDLRKLISEQQQESFTVEEEQKQNPRLAILLSRLRNKPFWYSWDNKEKHKREYKRTNGDCCLNHILLLPEKEGKPCHCMRV
jgi:hypothetical protein